MLNLGLEGFIPVVLYTTGILAFLLSVFWRPMIGIYFLVPLIPLQTIRYRINDFPLGASLVYVILLGIVLGLLRKGQPILTRTHWTLLLCIYVTFTFASMCFGSFYLGVEMPWLSGDRRFSDWADFMTMPVLFFLITAAVTEARQVRWLIYLMCLAVLMLDKAFYNTVTEHDFSTYSEELREGGTMGYAGSNGLASFEAQYATFLLAMASTQKERLQRWGFYALALFSAVCLMYSLSRGGYVALAAGCLFLGIVKQRKLLVAMLVFGLTWTSLVPIAVIARVNMTYDASGGLEHSAEMRVTLWEDAAQLINANLFLGTGYNTYRYMKRVGNYEDTHNIYLKILAETGLAGLLLFLWLLSKTFVRGVLLFRRAVDPFAAGLGLGLAGWVVCAIVANVFGDRWNYFQIQGYFWVLAALVARSWDFQETEGVTEE
ncbi:MAG: O-antigen ligase family protein [Acidobacteria bacterium]|nr:O-antigen ligase family protein [Acidobacteriota bacterium]